MASDDFFYIPPELSIELEAWLVSHPGHSRDWLFQTMHRRPGRLNANNFRERVLQPAAIRASIGVTSSAKLDKAGKPTLKTDCDFHARRRTCVTLFGARAKDPKSTEAQLRHADPSVTVRHYQKSIPSSVKAAADELERDLGFGSSDASERIKLRGD